MHRHLLNIVLLLPLCCFNATASFANCPQEAYLNLRVEATESPRAIAVTLDQKLALLLPDEAESRQTERQYVKKQLEKFIDQLRANRVDRKSTKKKIKFITEAVEGRFLREPSAKANIPDFFRYGKYSDATLTLVYAILMEAFDVPWLAMVDHWDVYLLVDPSGKQQQLAGSGVDHTRALERGYRTDYVNLLNLTLLPGQRPTSSEGVDSLYFMYHYAEKELLNFKQLAAYWHYERALRAYYYRDYLLTVRRLGVARQLEQRLAFAALEQATYLQLANLAEEDGKQALFYLFELWAKDQENQYIPSALLTSFIRQTDLLVQEGRDFGRGEQLYTFLFSRGGPYPRWRADLQELYYLQKTRFAAKIGRYDQVKVYVDSLYQMEPDNPVFRELASEMSLWTLRSTNATGTQLKGELEQIMVKYPFVRQTKGINDLLLADLAKEIRGYYEADQGYEGDNLLLQFRTKLSGSTPGKRRAMWVLTAYLAASNYYFRQQEYIHALRLIEEGLRYSPEDDYLLHRQDVLSRY